MAKGVITPQEKRSEIIAKIRDEGMTVAEASRKYNIGSKAIYNWMRDGIANSSTSLILENNRLKKENEQLYNLLGRATVELKKSKR
jgi:transposase-like protein